jgi:TonB family protein
MDIASVPNLLAIAAQLTCVAVVGGAVIAVLRITSPQLGFVLWRVVLVVCLAVPWLQTPRPPVAASDGGSRNAATFVEFQSAAETSRSVGVDWTSTLAIIIGVGVAIRIAWLTVGLLRLRRLRASGETMPPAECADLQRTLGIRAEVRYVLATPQPATFGLFRPVVLLPAALREAPSGIRDAVLAHEFVHVKRRDWAWLLCEEIVRAVFWCHPAMWWLVSRVQLAREEVVDAVAVATTGRKRDYVKALLAFSDDATLAPAPAFARRRHLFHRIVLLSTEEVMSTRRILVSAVALCLVIAVGAWSAVAAFPTQTGVSSLFQLEAGPVEQRASAVTAENLPLATHVEPATLPAVADAERASATVTLRTVVDESGNVAEVRLAGLSFMVDGISATISGTRLEEFFAKASFRTGATASRVTADTLRPVLEALIESAATAVRQSRYDAPRNGPVVFNTIVQFRAGESAAVIRAVSVMERMPTDGAIRVGGNVKPPVKIKDVKPVYPLDARDAGVQGVVILEVRIEPDGRVASAQVLRSIPLLDQAALDAVNQWEFMPTLLNGAPVPVLMTVTIQFTMP